MNWDIWTKKSRLFFIALSIIAVCFSTGNTFADVVIEAVLTGILAFYICSYTDIYSQYAGEKKGGLIAATLGNLPELAIGIWSIKFGMISLVKWSMIGAIMCNMLLVLGLSSFLGGIKYKEQKFNKNIARTNFNMLNLALVSMILLATVNYYNPLDEDMLCIASRSCAGILILVYLLGLIFSMITHNNLFTVSEESCILRKAGKEKNIIVVKMIITSAVLFFISGKLVKSFRIIAQSYGLSESIIGIFIVPMIGNIGENSSSIMAAINNKINMSIETAIGSSIQIALFETPVFVLIAYAAGMPMNMLFTPVQIIMAAVAAIMSFLVFADGKSYWFEGAILLAIYFMCIISCTYII